MSSKLLRRTFLGLAAASPFALGCASRATLPGSPQATLESALRRLVFALGPWPAHEHEAAERFFTRFWNAVPVSGPYREDAERLRRLSERFPPDTFAASSLDLAALPEDERELCIQLADGLYGLFEIRAQVIGDLPWGVCETHRERYRRPPRA